MATVIGSTKAEFDKAEMNKRAGGKSASKPQYEKAPYENLSGDAKELVLHADNDEHLYKSSHMPIVKNLQKKMAKGEYDQEKARKLWGYHSDRAAQSYHKEHGDKSSKWHEMFDTGTRKEAAHHFEDAHRDQVEDTSTFK